MILAVGSPGIDAHIHTHMYWILKLFELLYISVEPLSSSSILPSKRRSLSKKKEEDQSSHSSAARTF